MDCSMPGFPVLHYLPEFAQTQVHWVDDAIQPSRPLSSSSPSALNVSQHQGLFQWVISTHQVAKVLELQHQFFQWLFRVDILYAHINYLCAYTHTQINSKCVKKLLFWKSMLKLLTQIKCFVFTFRFGLYPKLIFLMPGTRGILCLTLLILVQFLFSPECLTIWWCAWTMSMWTDSEGISLSLYREKAEVDAFVSVLRATVWVSPLSHCPLKW